MEGKLKLDIDGVVYTYLHILTYIAAKCKHITEFGVGTQSSTLVFMGAFPSKIISYDF